jgi:hypothetical protein
MSILNWRYWREACELVIFIFILQTTSTDLARNMLQYILFIKMVS